MFAAGSKLEAELSKPEVDGLIKGKLEEVMRAGDQRMCALGFHAIGILFWDALSTGCFSDTVFRVALHPAASTERMI